MRAAGTIATVAVWFVVLAVGWLSGPAAAVERQTITKPVFEASTGSKNTCLDQAAVRFTDVLNRAVGAGLVTAAEPGATRGYNLLVAAELGEEQKKVRQNLEKDLLGYLAGAKKCLDEVLEDNRKKNLQTLIASKAPFEVRLKAFATYSLCMRRRYIGGTTLWLYLSGGHQPPAPVPVPSEVTQPPAETKEPVQVTPSPPAVPVNTDPVEKPKKAAGDKTKPKPVPSQTPGLWDRLAKAWRTDPAILLVVALAVGLPLAGVVVWLAWFRKPAAAQAPAEPKKGDPSPPPVDDRPSMEDGQPPLEVDHLAEALAPLLAERLEAPLAAAMLERMGKAVTGGDAGTAADLVDTGEGAGAPPGPEPAPDEATLLELYRRHWSLAGKDSDLTDELLRRFTLLPLVVANRSERFNQYYLDDPHFRFEPQITEAHYFLFPLAGGRLVLFPSPSLLRHLRVQERDSLGERAYCKYIYEISGQERDVMVQSPAWCAILGGQPLEGQVVVDERGNANRV